MVLVFRTTLVIWLVVISMCSATERNLEAEIDALKINFETMKNSYEKEMTSLRAVIETQSKIINRLQQDHQRDFNTLSAAINRCLESSPDVKEALKEEMKQAREIHREPLQEDILKRKKRSTSPKDNVPLLPFRRDIGDANEEVAFYAYLNQDVINLGNNQVIVFDHVETNLGNLYNNVTGVFYCETAGTYVFHVHIVAVQNKTVYTVLSKNGKPTSFMVAQSRNEAYSHGGNTAILQLEKGDSITVQNHGFHSSGGDVINFLWSSFSGFLLYPKLPDNVQSAIIG